MKNLLEYNYNLNVENIYSHKYGFIIKTKFKTYMLKEFFGNIDLVIYISNKLYTLNLKYYKALINRDGNIISSFDNKKYILLEIDDNDTEIKKMIYNTSEDQFFKTAKLWEEKIEYCIKQIESFKTVDNNLMIASNYYLGLAENCISLYNEYLETGENIIYSIEHYRLNYPVMAYEYYDITNMLIDIRLRDISEIIKSEILSGRFNLNKYKFLLAGYSSSEINLMMIRILFPSYFFDFINEELVSDNDRKVLEFLKKRKKYLIEYNRLKEMLEEKYQLFEIDWIKKELN